MDTRKQQTTKARVWTPANIVTLVRILLIPIFVVALLSPWPEWLAYPEFWAAWQPWIAAIVFAAISATDAVDGHLARSRNEVTDLGKFMDPLADKILVCAAMLALVELQAFPSWVALIIIAREFIVSGLRMVAAAQGKVIAASYYGKVKTVCRSSRFCFSSYRSRCRSSSSAAVSQRDSRFFPGSCLPQRSR